MRKVREGLWKLTRLILFRFDAENAHSLVLKICRFLSCFWLGREFLQFMSESRNIEISDRIGLAAGFDKNAEYLDVLELMGFGSVEIGTVTLKPQVGNPKPRLFRDPQSQSLFNCMGFNGKGAECVAQNLKNWRLKTKSKLKIGVNLGKNKDTELADAANDYLYTAQKFRDLTDYLVINVSSPNTPGLRALQNYNFIESVVNKLKGEIQNWKKIPKLYLKLAPELDNEVLDEFLARGTHLGLEGFVLTNTLGGEWVLNDQKKTHSAKKSTFLSGGWSGGRLMSQSNERLKYARSRTSLQLISVGGILNVDEAQQRWDHGADQIQIYSGWIFGGPYLISRLQKSLHLKIK